MKEVSKDGKENVRRQRCRTIGYGFLSLSLFVFLFGGTASTAAQTTDQTSLSEDKINYKIGVGDVLKILILKQDLLTQDGIRVGNGGTIRMPMIEEGIPAACLTEAELSAEITKRYKKYLLNPEVYVTVKEFNAYPVAVIGAVNASGRFKLQRPMRLLELLTLVNGPALNAGQYVQIFRDSNAQTCGQKPTADANKPPTAETAQPEIISLSLQDLMNGSEAANPLVQSGDIIRVTEAEVKQAFVIGNVKSPVTVNLKSPVTLSRAIAMAGGFSPGAKTDKVKISRQGSDSLAKTEILVNLKDVAARADDILLQPNDVVEVPGPKRNFLKDLFNGIVPAITRIPLVIP